MLTNSVLKSGANASGAGLGIPEAGGTLALPAPRGYSADAIASREPGLLTHQQSCYCRWGGGEREMNFSVWKSLTPSCSGDTKAPV